MSNTEKPTPMWQPPKGWYKAAVAARQETETRNARIEDNIRRKERGLPTYEV